MIEGSIDGLRVAVPTIRGSIHMRVDGTSIDGTIDNADDIRVLRNLQKQGVPVRVGVLTGAGIRRSFSWLIADRGAGVAPRYYADERRNAWRRVAIWLAVTAVALAIAWWVGLDTLWKVLTMIMSVIPAMIGLLFAGLSLHGLWIDRRHRSGILESESLYQQYRGTSIRATLPRAVPAPASGTEETVQFREENQLPIIRVRGRLASLTHEAHQPPKRPPYGVYRFVIGYQPYVMIVSEDFGDAMPFLAEGDQVEIAAFAGEISRDAPHEDRDVYAMRNLEDDRVYVCHRVLGRGWLPKTGPLGLGTGQQASILVKVGGVLLLVWLLVAGLRHFAATPSPHKELPSFATIVGFTLLACWCCLALPLLLLNLRSRLGWPTRRQRMRERVYLALDLGTPRAPKAHVEEL